MLSSVLAVVSALVASASLAAAQTSTSCNPTNTTCPSDKGLSSKTFSSDFTKAENSSWVPANYTTITYSDLGAAFTIKNKNDAPTIETDFYIFFGYVEVKMRAANGTGIVSSVVLESDDLDEVDWEFLGGNDAAVQTNFFGKGNTTTYNRMVSVGVSSATETFHTYALNWTSSSLTWLIDGTVVRTLKYTDAVALNGKNYPQTPCRLKLGAWAGGASTNEGTVQWAGGPTDFNDAPFTMYVESVKITNYNPGSSYTYADKSGDFGSIKVDTSASASTSASSSTATATQSKSSSSVSDTKSASGMNNTLETSTTSVSPAGSNSFSLATTTTPGFVQSTNGAPRSSDVSMLSNKIAYLILAALGIFVA